MKDQEILKSLGIMLRILIQNDPNLNHEDNKNIKSELNKITYNKKIWNLIS